VDFVEQLKSSVDIVKTVGEYVRLKRVGSTPRYTNSSNASAAAWAATS